jgi:hypothetical protein
MTTGWVERRIDAWLEEMTRVKEEKERLQKVPLTATVNVEEGEKQEFIPSTAQRRERLMDLIFEGFAQGTSGFVHETQMLTGHWGFKFEDIIYDKVQMWHGSRDANAPVQSIRDMAEHMPHFVLKEYDENHFTMGNHVEEVLKALIAEDHDDGGKGAENSGLRRR